MVRRKWPKWLVPSCISKPSFVRSSGQAITPASKAAAFSGHTAVTSDPTVTPYYLPDPTLRPPRIPFLQEHIRELSESEEQVLVDPACTDEPPVPVPRLQSQRIYAHGMEWRGWDAPALFTSTSSGRSPSRALLAKALMLARSARSTETASTFAQGTASLQTCILLSVQSAVQSVTVLFDVTRQSDQVATLHSRNYFILSLAARPFSRFLQARMVAYPFIARALAVSKPMPVLAPAQVWKSASGIMCVTSSTFTKPRFYAIANWMQELPVTKALLPAPSGAAEQRGALCCICFFCEEALRHTLVKLVPLSIL